MATDQPTWIPSRDGTTKQRGAMVNETQAHSPACAHPLYLTQWGNSVVQLIPCGPLDAPAISDWSDAVLHRDYFFKRGHWRSLLSSPEVQVYAIALCNPQNVALPMMVGIMITRHHTRLHNLYIDPAWRNQGIGSTALSLLCPDEIRCKTDMTTGDATDWYKRQGYRVIQEAQGPHGTISILIRDPQPDFPP